MKKESEFQSKLIKDLKDIYPGCEIRKMDSQQGDPDLLILYNDRWAMLECKREENAPHRPNQDYYVEKFNNMSFASFIYPENREEVLDELESAFRSRRKSCNPKRK